MALRRTAGRLEPILDRIVRSSGADGLDDLRACYPDSRFLWTESHGLTVFWNRADGPRPHQLLSNSAGFVEDLLTGEVLKDRSGTGRPMVRELVEDIDVLRVMIT